MLETMYHYLYIFVICALSILVFFSFWRALRSKSIPDRIVSINIIGTQVIAMIAVLCLLLNEHYLADIAIIYAIISFLSVVVMCKIFLGAYYSRKAKGEENNANH